MWLHDVWGNGSDWDVYGRFIPWSGPSGALADFMICNWNSNQAQFSRCGLQPGAQ